MRPHPQSEEEKAEVSQNVLISQQIICFAVLTKEGSSVFRFC